MELYETLPIVPLRDVVVFPHMMMPFVIGRPSSTRALEHALGKDKRIFLAASTTRRPTSRSRTTSTRWAASPTSSRA
jgi:ATP-dependent Lon protease